MVESPVGSASSRSSAATPTGLGERNQSLSIEDELARDGPTRYGPRKRRKITRSKAGCLVCRSRKKLCDMARPTCGSCVKLGRNCEWPPVPISSESDRSASVLLPGTPTSTPGSSSHYRPSLPLPADVIESSLPSSSTAFHAPLPFGNDKHHAPDAFSLHATSDPPQPPGTVGVMHADDAWLVDLLGGNAGGASDARAAVDIWPGGLGGASNGNTGGLLSEPERNYGQGQGQPNPHTQDQSKPSVGHGASGQMHGTDDLWDPAMWTSLFDPPLDFSVSGLLSNPLISPMQSSTYAAVPQDHLNCAQLPTTSLSISSDPAQDDALWRKVEGYFASTPDTNKGTAALTDTSRSNPYLLLATQQHSSLAPCLREGLLAIAALVSSNQGEPRFEAISHRKDAAATAFLSGKLGEWQLGAAHLWTDEERWTMLASVLVMLHIKRLRGDAFGFERYTEALRSMGSWVEGQEDARAQYLFEDIALHDLFSTAASRQGFTLDYTKPTILQRDKVFPLTGITLPLLPLVKRVLDLVHRRKAIANITWDDDQHVDMVEAAESLLDELKEEKKRMDRLTTEHPHLAAHRFLHESFRTACLLHIRGYVFSHAPSAVDIGLLVRQNLSLLETMLEQKLPGLGLVHWVLFITAIHCIPSKSKKTVDERTRMIKLYDGIKTARPLIGQIDRTKRIVQEIWKRNHEGNLFLDWMETMDEWEWEIFFL